MGFAVNAAQPTSVSGKYGGTTVTLSSHVTQFNISQSAENFYLRSNNLKYEQDGGAVGYQDSAELVCYDLRKHASLGPGAYWSTVTATYASEGASANGGTYGTLTATISAMRIESSNKADNNGRLAISATCKLLSVNGTTAPVSWAVS